MTALILEAHIAALSGRRKFGELLSESLRLNFNIDVVFPDRNSNEIFNIYRNRIDQDETASNISMEAEPSNTHKRKQKDLSPPDNQLEPEPKPKQQKQKKRHSKPESIPTPVNSPVKSTTSKTSKKPTSFYIYKSHKDTHNYDPLPSPVDLYILMYNKKIKLGLPQNTSRTEFLEDLRIGRTGRFRPAGKIQPVVAYGLDFAGWSESVGASNS